MTDRQTYLDSAAGILLVYMILYHCAQWAGIGESFVFNTLWLSFFMPWFFFKAGMVHRQYTFAETFRKGFKRLIIPWLIYNIIGSLVYFAALAVTGEPASWSYVAKYTKRVLLTGTTIGNLALWFLTSLFAVRLLYNLLSRTLLGYILLVAILAVPFLLHYEPLSIELPYYLANVPLGLLFYTAGHLLRSWHPRARVLLVIMAIYTASTVVVPAYMYMYQNTMLTGPYFLYPPIAILGCLSINGLCRLWFNRPCPASRIGADTMDIYCTHWIVIVAVSAVCAAQKHLLLNEIGTSTIAGWGLFAVLASACMTAAASIVLIKRLRS